MTQKSVQLLQEVLPVIKKRAYEAHQKHPNIPFEDFYQEAQTDVWQAIVEKYDETQSSIVTYAWPIASYAFQKVIARESGSIIANPTTLKKAHKLAQAVDEEERKEIIAKYGISEKSAKVLQESTTKGFVRISHEKVEKNSVEIQADSLKARTTSNPLKSRMLNDLQKAFEKAGISSKEGQAILIFYGFEGDTKDFETTAKNPKQIIGMYQRTAVKKIQTCPNDIRQEIVNIITDMQEFAI